LRDQRVHTFSLTQIRMAKMWLTERHRERRLLGTVALHTVTLILSIAILAITT
jgi:hypothetical protein